MSSNATEIFLKDYKRPEFWIQEVNLDFDIFETHTIVKSELTCQRNSEYTELQDLVLNGVDLKLISIAIDGVELEEDSYSYQDELLRVKTDKNDFVLSTVVEIHPEKNDSCEGLYKSGSIFCTQNEAEGFRKITFYSDRPDVMAKFKTTVRGDKALYPYLLSNGNKVADGELEGGRHFATWEDPHRKPCYLYAVVAGDLALVKDQYTTSSGREVALEIYVDHGNEDKCEHAMISLINSMKWDEEKFGLEYDLDIYMIVAVDSFNMGAMENKGLNIFNSAYVLAKKETATDSDFQGVEAVIGHEYFHNWTGNRVTCRDWFQLTLKEGLTVFRDQEFSSDMLSRSVKRIDDVKGLRSHQFPEDAGAMSHPIKPKSYIEMNNFYTSTVYEKGAEVIRMIHTLLGAENFRKGMDLYFKRHDGEAVTTEDFVSAMSDASCIDLEQFKVWYDQNGTPKLKIETQHIEETNELMISIDQSAKLNRENRTSSEEYSTLHMPFHFAIYNSDGEKVEIKNDGQFELKTARTTISLKGVKKGFVPSWNTNFTAPVIVNYDYSLDDLIFLMQHDQDEFNKYDSCQKLFKQTIDLLRESRKKGEELKLDEKIIEGIRSIITSKHLDPAFKAYAVEIPGLRDYSNELEKFDLENTDAVLKFMKKTIASSLKDDFLSEIKTLDQVGEFKLDPQSMGERAFKNRVLSYLFVIDEIKIDELVFSHFSNATNMTDEIGALSILCSRKNSFKEKALNSFYEKWKNETLVIQKWLAIQAESAEGLEEILKLETLEVYDKKVPNLVRSLIAVFAVYNLMGVNKEDGSGYRFLADKIIELDTYNPQIASRISSRGLGHSSKLDEGRLSLLQTELRRILETKNLSKDTFEIVSKFLD